MTTETIRTFGKHALLAELLSVMCGILIGWIWYRQKRSASKKKVADLLNISNHWLHWTVVGVLVLFAVLLRLKAFQGYSDSDPQAYTELAYQLSRGNLLIGHYNGPPVFPLRIGVYGPVSFIMRWWGLSELSIIAVPFLASVLALFLTYIFGRKLFGPLGGLVSLAVAAVVPMDLTMSSLLLPDLLAALWANMGIFLLYLALQSESIPRVRILAVGAGLLFGASWLCKETVAYLVPLVLLILFTEVLQSHVSARWAVIFS